MIWNAYHTDRARKAERTAEKADSRAERLEQSLEDLRKHVDRLSLASQAMWELLRDHSDLCETDIEKKILEIDGRDGYLDGKIGGQVFDCLACGSKTNSKRDTCVMCGAPVRSPHRFG